MKPKRKPIEVLARDLEVDLGTIAEACEFLGLPSVTSQFATLSKSESEAIAEYVQEIDREERSWELVEFEETDSNDDEVMDDTFDSECADSESSNLASDSAALFLKARSLEATDEVLRVLSGERPRGLKGLVYNLSDDCPTDLSWALDALESASTPAPPVLIPFMPVDERSFACVVCKEVGGPQPPDFGKVVRWHLGDVPDWAQRQVLDVNVKEYLATMAEDLAAKDAGLKLIDKIIRAYHESHGKDHIRPRHYHERPIRVASQNVVIGHAAIRHDDMFNGLSARVWQSCQVPHLAAHEGTRALAALTLGEAFRSGGTMEIRFDRHPERRVPAVLRQFARTRDVELGKYDPQSIHPAEARKLMWAVTEMPNSLRTRLEKLTTDGLLTPERACFVLLSGIWLPIELDFLAATSSRLLSILRGGSDPRYRAARQAELAVCRAAHMLGVLFKVLSAPEDQTSDEKKGSSD